MYGDQFGEFVCGYWGFKGLILPVGHYRVQEILNHCRISVLLFC